MNYPLSTEETILAVDIGNSAIKFGLFEGETLYDKFSIPTNRDATADDLWRAVGDRVRSGVDRAIACSVVPPIDAAMRSFLCEVSAANLSGRDPIFVTNSFDFGLKINYSPLESLGTDRLANGFAAVELHGAPCIVCSMGTATTIDVVSADREFIGGIIAPGIEAMAEALHLKAPRLPEVDGEKPMSLIGNSTTASVGSGVYNGYVAMVEGLLTRVRSESGVMRIVATGGNAVRLADEFAGMLIVEEDLVLRGLSLLSRNSNVTTVAEGDKH